MCLDTGKEEKQTKNPGREGLSKSSYVVSYAKKQNSIIKNN